CRPVQIARGATLSLTESVIMRQPSSLTNLRFSQEICRFPVGTTLDKGGWPNLVGHGSLHRAKFPFDEEFLK
ncbi:MAG TPA: hypothetical protein VHU19_16625, partial [Pyrinomonadaceae bacterium]|nr:hypothetical protein [Pyrinomonadaceae bacterium]